MRRTRSMASNAASRPQTLHTTPRLKTRTMWQDGSNNDRQKIKGTTYPWYPRVKAKATSAPKQPKKTRDAKPKINTRRSLQSIDEPEGSQKRTRVQSLLAQHVLQPDTSSSKQSKQLTTTSSMTLRGCQLSQGSRQRKRTRKRSVEWQIASDTEHTHAVQPVIPAISHQMSLLKIEPSESIQTRKRSRSREPETSRTKPSTSNMSSASQSVTQDTRFHMKLRSSHSGEDSRQTKRSKIPSVEVPGAPDPEVSKTRSSTSQQILPPQSQIPAHHTRRLRGTSKRKRVSSVEENTRPESDHWQSVMELFDFIEAQLHQLAWIRGCLISEDHLELVVNIPEEEALKIIRQWVPQRLLLKKVMKLNYDRPPRMELVYGSGSAIRSKSIQKGLTQDATVSLMGSLGTESYAFSVGHIANEGASYAIYKRRLLIGSYGHSAVQVSCINSIHTTDVENLVKKGHDVAVFRFPTAVSQDNIIEGFSVTFDKTQCGTYREMALQWMSKKVQVLGNYKHYTQKGTVKKVVGATEGRQFVFNAFQIEGDEDFRIIKGQSGSLVTTVPDPGSSNVRAFAFIVGREPGNPCIGFALHLWENLSKVCEDHLDINNDQEYELRISARKR